MASLKAPEMPNIFEVIAFLKHLDPLYLELVRLVWEECNIGDLQVMKLKGGQMLYLIKKNKKPKTNKNPKSNIPGKKFKYLVFHI